MCDSVVLGERSIALEMKETWLTELARNACDGTGEVLEQQSSFEVAKSVVQNQSLLLVVRVAKLIFKTPHSQVEASMMLDENIKPNQAKGLQPATYAQPKGLYKTLPATYEPWTFVVTPSYTLKRLNKPLSPQLIDCIFLILLVLIGTGVMMCDRYNDQVREVMSVSKKQKTGASFSSGRQGRRQVLGGNRHAARSVIAVARQT